MPRGASPLRASALLLGPTPSALLDFFANAAGCLAAARQSRSAASPAHRDALVAAMLWEPKKQQSCFARPCREATQIPSADADLGCNTSVAASEIASRTFPQKTTKNTTIRTPVEPPLTPIHCSTRPYYPVCSQRARDTESQPKGPTYRPASLALYIHVAPRRQRRRRAKAAAVRSAAASRASAATRAEKADAEAEIAEDSCSRVGCEAAIRASN